MEFLKLDIQKYCSSRDLVKIYKLAKDQGDSYKFENGNHPFVLRLIMQIRYEKESEEQRTIKAESGNKSFIKKIAHTVYTYLHEPTVKIHNCNKCNKETA